MQNKYLTLIITGLIVAGFNACQRHRVEELKQLPQQEDAASRKAEHSASITPEKP